MNGLILSLEFSHLPTLFLFFFAGYRKHKLNADTSAAFCLSTATYFFAGEYLQQAPVLQLVI